MTPERLAINAADLADLDAYQLGQAFKKARTELKWFPKVKELRDLSNSIRPNTVIVSTCSGGCELCDGQKWVVKDNRAHICPNWKLIRIPITKARTFSEVDGEGNSITRYALPVKEVKQLPAATDEERKEFFDALKDAAKKINLNSAPVEVFTRGKEKAQ